MVFGKISKKGPNEHKYKLCPSRAKVLLGGVLCIVSQHDSIGDNGGLANYIPPVF